MTNRTQISSPRQLLLFSSPLPSALPFPPQGSECNCVVFLQNIGGEVWRLFFDLFFWSSFVFFFRAQGHIRTYAERGKVKGSRWKPRGLKVFWCLSECQVEFLRATLGNESGFGVETTAIRGIPYPSKGTYCTLELLKCGAPLLSVRCTGRNVITIDSIGILLFLITKIRRQRRRELRRWLQQSATDLSPRSTNQSTTPHYWWHITLSQFGLLVNSKQ